MNEFHDGTPEDVVRYPMVPIRDVVVFPHTMVAFVIGRKASVYALEEAEATDKTIFLSTQHDATIDEPTPDQVYRVGTLATITHSLHKPDGNIKVMVEGVERARAVRVDEARVVDREAPLLFARFGCVVVIEVRPTLLRRETRTVQRSDCFRARPLPVHEIEIVVDFP